MVRISQVARATMTRVRRAIASHLRAVEVPLLLVTLALGIYLAAGNILDAANVPDESTWEPGKVWFIVLLVAAVWVPIYAVYQTLEARLQSRAKIETEA